MMAQLSKFFANIALSKTQISINAELNLHCDVTLIRKADQAKIVKE